MSEDWLGYEELKKEIEKLRSQNARYKAALEFYAEPVDRDKEFKNPNTLMLDQYGRKAREALKEVDDK